MAVAVPAEPAPDPGSVEPEEPDDERVGPLPDAVRTRVVALTAEALAALPVEEVPASVRPFRRFTPTRRVQYGAASLAAAVRADRDFRERVAARVRETRPELAAALDAGRPPATADPCDVAAAAYLLRPARWSALMATAAAEATRASDAAQGARALQTVARLQEQLAAVRAQGRADLDRLRADLHATKAENTELRRRLGHARDTARRAEEAARAADAAAEEVRAGAGVAASAAEAELRRLRARLTEVESERETSRRSAREGRALEDARLRLLLDTVLDAAAGLRRELALPPLAVRPADVVAAVEPGQEGVEDVAGRGRSPDDPALLDALLALPQVHLVVDGYNVTKTGYGSLTLEEQRRRLLTGLAALAAQTGAEVTCCFDGAALDGSVPSAAVRGVRVRFSSPGEIADELVRRIVRNEPPGRPVIVISSDKEVSDGVRRSGARPVPAVALLRRLDRC